MDKKKILKFIGIFLIIIFLILLIFFIRNFIIISNLSKSNSNTLSSNNYSCSLNLNHSNDTTFEYYYKDGIIVELKKINNDVVFKNWYDTKSKEHISIDLVNSTVQTRNKNDMFVVSNLKSSIDNIFENKFKSAIMFSIRNDDFNGEKCYKLNSRYGLKDYDYYFNKNTGIIKSLNHQMIVVNDFKVNNVTDLQVEKPDLSNYNI